MTAGVGLGPLARVAAAHTVCEPLRVPAGASHLVGLGTGPGADQLRHAVKVDRVAVPAAAAPPGTAWTRWLVWLGDACPPGPPSHLRFGRVGEGCPAGVVLPYAGSEAAALTVVADAQGRAVVADAGGVRWHEQPLYAGRPVADSRWRLAGCFAAPHHRQVPVAGRGSAQTVLIVRPLRAGAA